MAIGGPVLKQHNVEFIRGVGVRTDGVLTSSASTSFTWEVPQGVAQIFITGVGGGGGGGSGYNTGTARAGGGGGGSGTYVIGLPVYVYPKSTLTISPGQGGAGGAVGSDAAANGTVTSITGLPAAHIWTLVTGGSAGQLTLGYGQRGRGFNATAGATSGSGGVNVTSSASLAGGAASTGGPNGPTPSINTGAIVTNVTYDLMVGGFCACAGGAGGAASTTTPNPPAGAPGSAPGNGINLSAFTYVPGGDGGTDGTNSYGGGGRGGHSPWGIGGAGGGNSTGTSQAGGNGTGYGTGGGGGGGSGAGGAGTDGYVMITYFSYD